MNEGGDPSLAKEAEEAKTGLSDPLPYPGPTTVGGSSVRTNQPVN